MGFTSQDLSYHKKENQYFYATDKNPPIKKYANARNCEKKINQENLFLNFEALKYFYNKA